jgi:hypothetical protein
MHELSIHPLLELRQTCKYFRFIVDSYLKSKYNTIDILIAIRITCEWTIVKEYSEEHYYKKFLYDTSVLTHHIYCFIVIIKNSISI